MIAAKCTGCGTVPLELSGPNVVCDCVATEEYLGEGFQQLNRMLHFHGLFGDYLDTHAGGS